MDTHFYSNRHQTDATYSAGQYDTDALLRHPVLSRWFVAHRARINILDVGVGKGLFLNQFINGATLRCCLTESATGVDLVKSEPNFFDHIKTRFEFIQADANQPLPLAVEAFDFIACNHVLEHVFNTEQLLRSLHRCLAPDGLCVVSVPNLAYWPNRLAALWGCQPLGSETGTERTTYGFRPACLQPRLLRWKPSGHIRDFTPAALRDIAVHCGFTVAGWWKQSFGLLARLSPHAARNIAVILKK